MTDLDSINERIRAYHKKAEEVSRQRAIHEDRIRAKAKQLQDMGYSSVDPSAPLEDIRSAVEKIYESEKARVESQAALALRVMDLVESGQVDEAFQVLESASVKSDPVETTVKTDPIGESAPTTHPTPPVEEKYDLESIFSGSGFNLGSL